MNLALASTLAAATTVADALTAAGVRVATAPSDVTTPSAYLSVESVDNKGAVLAGGALSGIGVAWIPIRGMAELYADAAALDAIRLALRPSWSPLCTSPARSVLIGDNSWPCYFGIAYL